MGIEIENDPSLPLRTDCQRLARGPINAPITGRRVSTSITRPLTVTIAGKEMRAGVTGGAAGACNVCSTTRPSALTDTEFKSVPGAIVTTTFPATSLTPATTGGSPVATITSPSGLPSALDISSGTAVPLASVSASLVARTDLDEAGTNPARPALTLSFSLEPRGRRAVPSAAVRAKRHSGGDQSAAPKRGPR